MACKKCSEQIDALTQELRALRLELAAMRKSPAVMQPSIYPQPVVIHMPVYPTQPWLPTWTGPLYTEMTSSSSASTGTALTFNS